MTERINGPGLRSADAAQARRTEVTKPAPAGPLTERRDAQGQGDTVRLTASARLLAKLEEAVRNSPAVDTQRVAALKDAIASGTYRVDAQALADNLLRLDRELDR